MKSCFCERVRCSFSICLSLFVIPFLPGGSLGQVSCHCDLLRSIHTLRLLVCWNYNWWCCDSVCPAERFIYWCPNFYDDFFEATIRRSLLFWSNCIRRNFHNIYVAGTARFLPGTCTGTCKAVDEFGRHLRMSLCQPVPTLGYAPFWWTMNVLCFYPIVLYYSVALY